MLTHEEFVKEVKEHTQDTSTECKEFVSAISSIFYIEYLRTFEAYSAKDHQKTVDHAEYVEYLAKVFLPKYAKAYYDAAGNESFMYGEIILNVANGSYTDQLAITIDFLMFVFLRQIVEHEDNI